MQKLIDEEGRLREPVLRLFHALYGYGMEQLRQINIQNGARELANAETWNARQIRYNPDAHKDKGETELHWWLSTLSHEVHHCMQFRRSLVPAPLNRFFNWLDRKLHGHDNSAWEKEAMIVGMKTLAFCMHHDKDLKELFFDPDMDEKLKTLKLELLALDYRILLADRRLKELDRLKAERQSTTVKRTV